MKEIYDVTVPAWSLNYFINGVTDNLTDEEIEMLDKWWNENFIEIIDPWNDEGDIEEYFSHSNDITNIGDSVVDCKAILRDHYAIVGKHGITIERFDTEFEAMEALIQYEKPEGYKVMFYGKETIEINNQNK